MPDPMNTPIPLTRDLVLVGGGHTHALVLRKWGMQPLPGVRLTVINPGPTAPYSGMLPGFVAGHYTRQELDIDLVKLARFANARLICGKAVALDPDRKTITVPDRPPVAYDVASVDVGITSEMPALEGFEEYGVPAKPLGIFASRWDAFRNSTTDAKVAVIGGGVAGAELAMAMAFALRHRGLAPEITLIDRGQVLDGFAGPARSRLMAALDEQGVTCIENATVAKIKPDHVELSDGRTIQSHFTTGAAGARPHDWIARTGLDVQDGFLEVGPMLQTSDPDVFAVGDCAHLSHNPRPKAGVFAVREAPFLYDNLKAHLSGGSLRPYRPQKDYLKLISLGGKSALAEKLGTARRGALLWRWKDHIDRKFMDQFDGLEPMASKPLPLKVADGVSDALGDAPLCRGCGAKVGKGALSAALADIPISSRKDIERLEGDDAALLKMGTTRQVITADHLSAVTEDPAMMARIAAVHALGDIWAMGAAPQAAVISLIVPQMSAELQSRTVAEIMSAAADVVSGAGADIVGGHTTMGDTLTIGFTMTGLCKSPPITLSGAQSGDALILTKPLGSGTILAAEMRGKAGGADVLACLDQMVQPQASAASILATANAMTDVTGFGLAGHLEAMCKASGLGASVQLSDIPLLSGGLDLATAGIRSSLFPQNRSDSVARVPADNPLGDLMFDPQTCGGLLAAVPSKQSAAILKKLKTAGYDAAIIGTMVEGDVVSFS